MYVHRFQVKAAKLAGSFQLAGSFPVDMLRYDSCIPDTEQDANNIIASIQTYGTDDVGEITLRHYSTANNIAHALTEARWQSFGWQIVNFLDSRKIS